MEMLGLHLASSKRNRTFIFNHGEGTETCKFTNTDLCSKDNKTLNIAEKTNVCFIVPLVVSGMFLLVKDCFYR